MNYQSSKNVTATFTVISLQWILHCIVCIQTCFTNHIPVVQYGVAMNIFATIMIKIFSFLVFEFLVNFNIYSVYLFVILQLSCP